MASDCKPCSDLKVYASPPHYLKQVLLFRGQIASLSLPSYIPSKVRAITLDFNCCMGTFSPPPPETTPFSCNFINCNCRPYIRGYCTVTTVSPSYVAPLLIVVCSHIKFHKVPKLPAELKGNRPRKESVVNRQGRIFHRREILRRMGRDQDDKSEWIYM